MAKNVFSGFRSARLRPSESSRARRRVTTWAAIGVIALLATLLTPLSTASAQPSAPAAPTITSATPSDGAVTLTWDAGADNGSTVIRWEYQQTTPATNLWIPIPGSDRHMDRYTITGLDNGTAYAFSLRAINGAGNGAAGDMSALTPSTVTPSTTPGAPVGLRATEGNSQVTLNWTAAVTTGGVAAGQNDGFSTITGYEIRQKTGDADYAPWAIIIGSSATTAEHVVTGLTNGVAYQFQVRARNANGAGAASETQPVTIATVPGRPRSLTAVPGDGQVALSWVASSDGGSPILSWQFRLSTTGTAGFTSLTDPAWVTIPDSNADTNSYTVESLDNDEEYTFQIRAVNAEGPGTLAESDEVNPGEPPGRPTALQAAASANSVTISWTPPLDDTALDDGGSPIIRYEYSQSTNGGEFGEWTAIPANMLFATTSAEDRTLTATAAVANTATATMGHTVRGLTAGTAYSYRVRAVNATGPGEYASMLRAVYPGTKPPAPANLNARANYDTVSGSASITLTWSSGGDGGSPIYRWEYITNTDLAALSTAAGADGTTWTAICDNTDGFSPDCADTVTVTVPRARTAAGTFPDGTLTYVDRTTAPTAPALSQAEHHFVVRAVNARGNGFQSGTDSARFSATVPSAPPAVYIGATAADSITLTWPGSVDGGSAITRYEYQVKVGSGSYGAWVRDDLTPGVQYDVPSGTPAGTVHQFRVRAVNLRGAGSYTESPAIVPGAPGTPGATDLSTADAPELTATPGTTQVTLMLTGTTGGVGTTTLWEYSYKIGNGEWGGWLYAGEDGQFDPTDINPSLTDGAIDGLENGVPHQFRIRASNPGGLHGPILESNTVIPGVAPPAPQGLTASAGDRSITLSWTSGGSGGPPINGWHYCASSISTPNPADPANPTVATQTCAADEAVGTGGWTRVPRSHGGTTSFTLGPPTNTLVNGTTYTYLVRANNAIGIGARAQAAPATPGRAPGAPARALVDAGDGEVTIRVDMPAENNGSPVVGYQVRKSADGGPFDAWESLGTTVRPPRTPSAQSGAKVTGLTNGVTYTFEVRAVNGFGPGSAIGTHPASITPTGAPTANMLAADPGDSEVTLSWNQLSSGGETIVKWQYRQSESGGGFGPWTDIADSGPATTSHTVTGLDNGTSYSFEVRGVNVKPRDGQR